MTLLIYIRKQSKLEWMDGRVRRGDSKGGERGDKIEFEEDVFGTRFGIPHMTMTTSRCLGFFEANKQASG